MARRKAGEPLAVAASSQASTMFTPALMSASSAAASRDSARECRAVPSSGTGRKSDSMSERQCSPCLPCRA